MAIININAGVVTTLHVEPNQLRMSEDGIEVVGIQSPGIALKKGMWRGLDQLVVTSNGKHVATIRYQPSPELCQDACPWCGLDGGSIRPLPTHAGEWHPQCLVDRSRSES